jgi:hypothetical protein
LVAKAEKHKLLLVALPCVNTADTVQNRHFFPWLKNPARRLPNNC